MISYLQVENLSKRYGEVLLFQNISFGIGKDQKVALIAKNGTGKTSLLNIIAGKESPDTGLVTFRNDLKVGYLEQSPFFGESQTVLEYVLHSADEVMAAIRHYEKALAGKDKHQIQSALEQMDRLQAWDYELKIKQILTQLDITQFEHPVSLLSGGQKKRVALAQVLIDEPDFLILDEPTNHLDLDMIEWLEDFLQNTNTTLLMVTHDRYFLDRVCNEIYELESHSIHHYRGNYAYFLEKRDERLENQSANVAKASSLLKKELDWLRRMPKARGTKAKYRVENVDELRKQAAQKVQREQVKIDLQHRRLGKKILNLYNLEKRFDDLLILDDFTHKFAPNEKIGIVGKNGSGKTTLLNMIAGTEGIDGGKIETGATVAFGYYRQSGIRFKENQRVIELVSEIADVVTVGKGKRLSIKQFLEYFLFPPSMHYSQIAKLSGGEKRRLYLLTVLMKNPNFLILDEPTNDLDIMTLNVLEDYLQKFQGCVLIVSHDRYFMDKVVDTLFVFEGKGKIKNFPGNYTQYHQYRDQQQRLAKKTRKNTPQPPKDSQPQPKNKKKFSYKHKLEYEKTEQDLSQLEKQKKQIEDEINSGKFDHWQLREKSESLGKLLQQIDEKEMRWLELSELKDAEN